MSRFRNALFVPAAALALLVGCATGARSAEVERALATQPTGSAAPGLTHFDSIVPGILERFDVPGAGFAIVKDGRLVLARGYGLADVAAGRRVEPDTPFLLASVSKSITAATVLKLVEQGRLRFEDRAFAILDELRPPPGRELDPRIKQIAVQDLLYHAGGWDRETSGDPLTFEPRVRRALHLRGPMTPRELAHYMLGQPLDFTPATKCVYSNFGYMLLGMIIERVTGERYLSFVQETTLQPMGLRVYEGAGRTEYAPGEARRYGPEGQLVAKPGLPPVHFASGAWIASAKDMARFMARISGERAPGFLSPSLFTRMLSPPPPPVPPRGNGTHFGMGWDVVDRGPEGVLFEKDGGVLGTTTWVEHRPNGAIWVLLMNVSLGKAHGPELHRMFKAEIRRAIDAVTDWPTVDLFD